MNKTTFFQKFITCFVAGLTLSALWLSIGNSGIISWLPPLLIFSLVGISFIGSLIFPFTWHYREPKMGIDATKIYGFINGLIRYSVAFNLARFGWAKAFGLQFNVPETIASQPINQLSGEWLTWFYFGYSPTFGLIVAAIQIGGGLLLLFRRTVLLGSVILFSFMLNLTLINIFYQMNMGGLLQSILLTIGILFLILLDFNRLVDFFLKAKSTLPPVNWSNTILKNILRLSVVILPLLYTIYLKYLMK
jgi:hypothetical protein